MLLRLAAGSDQLAVQAQQLGAAGIVMLLQPVSQDQPQGIVAGILDDGLQQGLLLQTRANDRWEDTACHRNPGMHWMEGEYRRRQCTRPRAG
jgi:hypothetical protein